MIAVTPKDIDNTVYIDFRNKTLCPDRLTYMNKNSNVFRSIEYEPVPKDMIDEFCEEINEFINQNCDYMIYPFFKFIDDYNDRIVRCNININDFGSIYCFLYNFRNNAKKTKFYDKFINYFCDTFNADNHNLYAFNDDVEFFVYDKSKKDYYYLIEKEGKDPEIVLFKEYHKKHKIKYEKKNWYLLDELLDRNLDIAEEKSGYSKNLVYMIILKFATTVRNYPMLIFNPGDLK